MKTFKRALVFVFAITTMQTTAQEVNLLISAPAINDNIYVNETGQIYTASGGLTGYNTLGLYDLESGDFDANFASGFAGPITMVPYRDSLFVVSNYDDNTVVSYNLNSGEIITMANDMDGPAGIAIDDNENIYVTSWGGAPDWQGQQVHKITPEGNVQVYIDTPTLVNPQGIVFNQDGELIIRSQTSLYKVNPADSSLVFWTEVGYVVGNMVLRQQDGCIYAPGDHKVFKIEPDGNVEVLTGSTPGFQDGDLDEALFYQPLGIDFSPDEEILYVAESGYQSGMGSIREINLSEVSFVSKAGTSQVNVFPTVSTGEVSIHSEVGEIQSVRVFDSMGRLLVQSQQTSAQAMLNLSRYNDGVYYVEISSTRWREVQSIILSK